MPRTQIDALVTLKALQFVTTDDNLTEVLLDERADRSESLPVRNVCAKLSNDLADRLDSTTGFLGISKRRFIEAAIIDALDKSKEVMEVEGVFQHMKDMEEHNSKPRGSR